MHSNGAEFAPIDYQQLIPCVPILAILYGNPSHFTAQYNPYCTVKWVRLKRHRADFETSHASCWFSIPILLHINPITLYCWRQLSRLQCQNCCEPTQWLYIADGSYRDFNANTIANQPNNFILQTAAIETSTPILLRINHLHLMF